MTHRDLILECNMLPALLNHKHATLDEIQEGIWECSELCVMFPQPPSPTTREEEAAFDSKSSSGLKVSHGLLCLPCPGSFPFCRAPACDQAVAE